MTLRASKPAFNVREKLTELGRRFGLKGSELVAAETVQDARNIISAGRKNLIINGNPIVYQRAQTASNIASYQYHTADRWRFSQNGTNASNNRVTDMSVVTNADIAGDFIGNYVRFDTTTAATSPASNASVGYNYRMEPQDIVPYLGKEMTISFYARSNAGIAINSGFISGTTASSIYFSNQDDSSTWVTLTSNWKRYKFTFTLGTTVPSTHLDIGIRHQPGIVGHVDMTGIQLEVGRNATEFEHRPYGEELMLCERYFEKIWQNNNTASPHSGGDGYNTISPGVHNGSHGYYVWKFRTQKRIRPSLDYAGKFRVFGASSIQNLTFNEFYSPGVDAARLRVGHSGSSGDAFILEFDGGNSSNGYITANAEL